MSLLEETRRFLDTAVATAEDTDAYELLVEARARLDDTLRVAIAGPRNVGKSTLVNALVGEQVAPTDDSSATRVPSWYGDGEDYRGAWFDIEGGRHDLVPTRTSEGHQLSLEGIDIGRVRFCVLELPCEWLRRSILIDTPGLDSLAGPEQDESPPLFDPNEGVSPVDAVVYLLDHHDPDDVALLDAFADDLTRDTTVNAVAVIARADLVGGGDIDAVRRTGRIAERWAHHPRLAGRVERVLAVAPLAAEGAGALDTDHCRIIESVATLDPPGRARVLASAAGFAVDPDRRRLVDAVGIFGVRTLVEAWLDGVTDADALADRLVDASGLRELVDFIEARFVARADLLRCRSALLAVGAQLRHLPLDAVAVMEQQLDRVLTRSHELVELDTLDQLDVVVPPGLPLAAGDLRRLLGALGSGATTRLGLDPDASTDDVRVALADQLTTWHELEQTSTELGTRQLAAIVVRTLGFIDPDRADGATD